MSDYPELDSFFGAYFHQDWAVTTAEPWDVVAEYLAAATAEDIITAVAEIDRILARHLTETAMRSLVVDELDSGWWPEDDGWTYRGWLTEIGRRARTALRDPIPGNATLMHLLAGRYRQHWRTEESPDPWLILARFLNENPTPTLEILLRQIDQVLAQNQTEDALKFLIQNEFHCRYDAEAEGWTYRGWLSEIRRRTKAEINHRNELAPVPDAGSDRGDLGEHDSDAVARLLPGSPAPRATSVWQNETLAETTIAATLADNDAQIRDWLASGQRRTLTLAYNGSSTTGSCAERGSTSETAVTGALIILQRLITQRRRIYSFHGVDNIDYVLHSAYPAPAIERPNRRFPELQQLLGGYFNQDWAHIYGPDPWAVLTRYLAESGAPEIAAAAAQIDDVLALGLSNEGLADLVLNELWCYYFPDADQWTYRGWLTEVGSRSRRTLQAVVAGYFELGQLLGGYFGEDWATRFGPDSRRVLKSYLCGAPLDTITALIRQVDQILARGLTEAGLESLLWIDFGSRYRPNADGITYGHWLTEIRRAALAAVTKPTSR